MDQQELSRSILIGTALGDGAMNKTNKNGNARIRVGHSIDKSDYLIWKFKYLKEIMPITSINVIPGGKYRKSPNDFVYFTSHRTEYLTDLYFLLYKNGVKTITKEYLREFNDVSFAVFLMDDGSYDVNKGSQSYMLHTNSHSLEENELFASYLQQKFNLSPKLQHVNKGKGWAIRFPKRDTTKIEKIVSPTISQISCMRYKLHSVRQGIKEAG